MYNGTILKIIFLVKNCGKKQTVKLLISHFSWDQNVPVQWLQHACHWISSPVLGLDESVTWTRFVSNTYMYVSNKAKIVTFYPEGRCIMPTWNWNLTDLLQGVKYLHAKCQMAGQIEELACQNATPNFFPISCPGFARMSGDTVKCSGILLCLYVALFNRK